MRQRVLHHFLHNLRRGLDVSHQSRTHACCQTHFLKVTRWFRALATQLKTLAWAKAVQTGWSRRLSPQEWVVVECVDRDLLPIR